jgi:hypothetical protein
LSRSFHSRRLWAFSPFWPVVLRSTAAIQVPSRWGWVLPSVQVQTAKDLSAPPTVQRPRERSSRWASDRSNRRVMVHSVATLPPRQVIWVARNQPSSRPLPLQPSQVT